jgi:hypothetical protein
VDKYILSAKGTQIFLCILQMVPFAAPPSYIGFVNIKISSSNNFTMLSSIFSNLQLERCGIVHAFLAHISLSATKTIHNNSTTATKHGSELI